MKDDRVCPWCGKTEEESAGLVEYDNHLIRCWEDHERKSRAEAYDC